MQTAAMPKPACQPQTCATRPQTMGPSTAPKLIPVLKIAKPRVRRASSSRGYSAPTCAEMLPFRKPDPTTSSSSARRNDRSNAMAR